MTRTFKYEDKSDFLELLDSHNLTLDDFKNIKNKYEYSLSYESKRDLKIY